MKIFFNETSDYQKIEKILNLKLDALAFSEKEKLIGLEAVKNLYKTVSEMSDEGTSLRLEKVLVGSNLKSLKVVACASSSQNFIEKIRSV